MIANLDTTAEKQALEDLLASDGWRVFKALVGQRFGDAAQLREIDAAMAALEPADTPGQLAVVTQIRAASKACDVALELPTERLRVIEREMTQAEREKKERPDRFALLRRGPKTA